MRSINDYSDDELLRLAAKMTGVVGGKDRHDAIMAVIADRGLTDGRASFFQSLNATITGDDAQEG